MRKILQSLKRYSVSFLVNCGYFKNVSLLVIYLNDIAIIAKKQRLINNKMIWESCYWKEPLLKLVKKIKKWESSTTLEEADLAKIERELMMGFYSVRKLIESKKISDSVAQEKLICQSFSNLKDVNLLNWDCYEKLYDLNSPSTETLKLNFVYNQFIHSYVFIISSGEEFAFNGIYVSSDFEKDKNLYYIPSSEIKRIFQLVGENYPDKISKIYNNETKDYDITLK